MQRQGGVCNLRMPREKTDGVSLHEEITELAFEQWNEQAYALVGFNVIPTLQGSGIGWSSRTGRVQREYSLKLGGNTDCKFALSYE